MQRPATALPFSWTTIANLATTIQLPLVAHSFSFILQEEMLFQFVKRFFARAMSS